MLLGIIITLLLPLASDGTGGGGGFGNNNALAILSALGAGAIASLVTGYFARPKTKAETAQANTAASVSLSADAREWAQLWMKRSEDAERDAKEAEKARDQAIIDRDVARRETRDEKDRADNAEDLVAGYMAWAGQMEALMSPSQRIPPPQVVADWLKAHGA